MTNRTRRLLFISVLVVLFALPAEIVLVRALVTPQAQDAVAQWVGKLDDAKLATAASQIQFYPFLYRREVMRRLSPADRSSVWRGHLTSYLQVHPELDAAVVDAIKAVHDRLSPSVFATPTDAQRDALRTLAEQVQAALGRDEAEYLFYRLGPRDGTFASFEPLAMSMSNKVRSWFVATAAASFCDCVTSWGCYGYNTCSTALGCSADHQWPMCGWFWDDPCNGLCIADL